MWPSLTHFTLRIPLLDWMCGVVLQINVVASFCHVYTYVCVRVCRCALVCMCVCAWVCDCVCISVCVCVVSLVLTWHSASSTWRGCTWSCSWQSNRWSGRRVECHGNCWSGCRCFRWWSRDVGEANRWRISRRQQSSFLQPTTIPDNTIQYSTV